MKINIKLLVLFVLAYLVALLALTPLSWVKQYATPVLRAQGIQLEETQGNLWQGQGQLTLRTQESFQLEWDMRPLGLFTGRLPVDIHLSNPHLDMAGQIQVKPTGLTLNGVSGYVDEPLLQRFAQAYNATIQGRLVASELSASIGWGLSLGDATGDLTWSGGPLDYQMGRSSRTFEVPQMRGAVTSDEAGWRLDIRAMDDTPLIDATLGSDGAARIAVQRTLAERMNLPIPGGRETLVEMSQKVF